MQNGIYFTRRVKKLAISEKVGDISEILPKRLYLGNLNAASNLPLLNSLKVTHILNLSQKKPPYPNRFKYLTIDVADGAEDFFQHFKRGSKFINNGEVVLVHCQQGISRSSTMVIAFLMLYQGKTLEEAKSFVKTCRPQIKPNFNFEIQLLDLESQIKARDVGENTPVKHTYNLRSR